MEFITKLNDEYAVGISNLNIVIFGYFEDVDGIHRNIRQGSVLLDEEAQNKLYEYLQPD